MKMDFQSKSLRNHRIFCYCEQWTCQSPGMVAFQTFCVFFQYDSDIQPQIIITFHNMKKLSINLFSTNGRFESLLICSSYLWHVKRICVFEHSVMTNFNCACPAIQRGQGSGFLFEGSSWLTWTFAAHVDDKYQIRLTHPISQSYLSHNTYPCVCCLYHTDIIPTIPYCTSPLACVNFKEFDYFSLLSRRTPAHNYTRALTS